MEFFSNDKTLISVEVEVMNVFDWQNLTLVSKEPKTTLN